MGSVGFGQSEVGCQRGCPEGSWFLRYIRLQTVGSFFEVSLEPLLECVGLRNLVHLKGKKKRSVLLLQYYNKMKIHFPYSAITAAI